MNPRALGNPPDRWLTRACNANHPFAADSKQVRDSPTPARPMRDPQCETETTMSTLSEGPNTPGLSTDRQAGVLLLAFFAAVILVLAVATSLPAATGTASTGALTHQQDGAGTLAHRPGLR